MKKENLKWILNPMSEREMRLVKGREDLPSMDIGAGESTSLCDEQYHRNSCKTTADCTGAQICISSLGKKCCY